MKTLLTKLALLLVIVVICDFLIGKSLDHVVNAITTGGQGRDNYICNKSNEDIMIFGSSKAVHHYNSSILEDSLGMSCYNCGEDGNGILLSYGRLMMTKERHQPKIIIYDVVPKYDLLKNDNHQYLAWLKAHYTRDSIAEIFYDTDSLERYKMNCSCYRHNSKFLQNLIVYFTHLSTDEGIKGYRPLFGKLNTLKVKERTYKDQYEYDPVKEKYLHRFIAQSAGSRLYFVISPVWYKIDTTYTSAAQPLIELCQREGIPFIDFTNDPKYVGNDTYFRDGTHLNSQGASEFTRDLIRKIKEIDKNSGAKP